jgi:L-lactate dehydrogenase
MPKISIIGAGDVGTTIAYTLQVSGLATEIALIDIDQKLARGQVMDMNHGFFFVPLVRLSAGDYSDCSGADVIIVTAIYAITVEGKRVEEAISIYHSK